MPGEEELIAGNEINSLILQNLYEEAGDPDGSIWSQLLVPPHQYGPVRLITGNGQEYRAHLIPTQDTISSKSVMIAIGREKEDSGPPGVHIDLGVNPDGQKYVSSVHAVLYINHGTRHTDTGDEPLVGIADAKSQNGVAVSENGNKRRIPSVLVDKYNTRLEQELSLASINAKGEIEGGTTIEIGQRHFKVVNISGEELKSLGRNKAKLAFVELTPLDPAASESFSTVTVVPNWDRVRQKAESEIESIPNAERITTLSQQITTLLGTVQQSLMTNSHAAYREIENVGSQGTRRVDFYFTTDGILSSKDNLRQLDSRVKVVLSIWMDKSRPFMVEGTRNMMGAISPDYQVTPRIIANANGTCNTSVYMDKNGKSLKPTQETECSIEDLRRTFIFLKQAEHVLDRNHLILHN